MRGATMLSRLPRVILLHAASLSATAVAFLLLDLGRPTALAVFWAGAFSCWLTARSHVSSSILLRMTAMLADGPRPADALADDYQRTHGADHRRRQLATSGFVTTAGQLTAIGRVLAHLARRFQSGSKRAP